MGRYGRFVILIFLLGLSACASVPKPAPVESALHYLPEPGVSLLAKYAPVFWVEKYQVDYNRIGEVKAKTPQKIWIDPDSPILYAEQRSFSTSKGEYTNLIYRVHFQKIPSGLSPFYLGAGKNVGLLLIVTLNKNQQPLLFTTMHTCGCYLAFLPTSFLPPQNLPKGWKSDRQEIYGESLPTFLDYADNAPRTKRLQIRLRPETHRVMDLWLAAADSQPQPSALIPLRPLSSLQQLPLKEGQTTSFYEQSGNRKGYVKGSYKNYERLLMSWWALAWKIGQDKYLGQNKNDGPIFYTSLKPWARNASDVRDYARFLRYWGWDL